MFEFIDIIIVRPIANILFIIYNFVGDFGLAIILFTLLVRLCMWPLMKRQFHQTKLMRSLQPELAKIKKNCKGNRQMESIQTMDLYKRHNVKPFRSILTLLIQLPIFIAIYTAIRVMVMPTPTDNLEIRAYPFAQISNTADVIAKQQAYLADTATNSYDFHPQLFGLVNLDARATDIFSSNISVSAFIVLIFALSAAAIQTLVMRQQMPSSKDKKKKTIRQMMKEAAEGKEPDQSELNSAMTGQMTKIMPIMMLFIMIPLPGALVFYYLLINIVNAFQQKFIFKKDETELEAIAGEKTATKVQKIKEAQVIENKKTGTKITRISAKDNKKRRK
ncbi:membrane protein insertase YidC [Candidatus Saccharibacteria bacterium]|nr:membrane protein insertase YidC [Candidatus Saccharibacteria bacterium]